MAGKGAVFAHAENLLQRSCASTRPQGTFPEVDKAALTAEPNVVMLIGNTGVGKSSLGCRLLGTLPNRSPEEPFKVAMQHSAVTLTLKTVDGTWFGEGESPLRVVDTVGL